MKRFGFGVLLPFLLLCSCQKGSTSSAPVLSSPAEEKPLFVSALGDSITYGEGVRDKNDNWTKLITADERIGKVQNLGFNGSMVGLSGSVMDAYSFQNRWSEISQSATVVFVLGGTNDYGSDSPVPLGTKGDKEATTFYGAYDHLIRSIRDARPKAKILCATPLQRSDLGVDGDYDTENRLGYRLTDYCKALKEVCGCYDIPVLDLQNSPSFVAVTETFQAMFDDGLHPNKEGNRILAEEILTFLKENV